jgi:uncharacterized protein (DUF433 family)
LRLEDYIGFQGHVQSRVKRRRTGIGIILGDYLEEGLSAEEIVWRYPALTLEGVHAVLACYWSHKADMTRYLQRVRESEDLLFDKHMPHRAIHKLLQARDGNIS